MLSQKKPALRAPQSSAGPEHEQGKKRRGPRLAYLSVAGLDRRLACTLHDYTLDGAVIVLSGWIGIPDSFALHVEPEGEKHACRIVLRKGNAVKVAFAPAIS